MSVEVAVTMVVIASATALFCGILVERARTALRVPQPAPQSVTVTRITNAALLAFPRSEDPPLFMQGKYELAMLFDAAFANPNHPDPGPVLAWVAEHVDDPSLAVFVARVGDDPWSGLSIASDWTSPFSPYPWVLHFYAPGSRDLRIALSQETARWCQSRGHDRTVAINLTGKSDAQWIAAHRQTSTGRVVASYGEFTLRDDL